MSNAFWEARPALQHTLTLARARGVGPWATLGGVLARAIATIPPEITLPGIIGSRMSLNLFIALVGPSGGGKGAAEATALDGFSLPFVDIVPLGTGEGIARTYRPIGTKPEDPNVITNAIFTDRAGDRHHRRPRQPTRLHPVRRAAKGVLGRAARLRQRRKGRPRHRPRRVLPRLPNHRSAAAALPHPAERQRRDNALLMNLLQRLDEPAARYHELDLYYRGEQPLAFLAPEAKAALGERFGRMATNIPRLAVTALAERLRVTGLSGDAAEVWPDWIRNDLDQLSGVAHREALLLGDVSSSSGPTRSAGRRCPSRAPSK